MLCDITLISLKEALWCMWDQVVIENAAESSFGREYFDRRHTLEPLIIRPARMDLI